jgi:hypothetical protein
MLLNSVDSVGPHSFNSYPIALKIMLHAHFSNVRSSQQVGPFFGGIIW